MDVFLTWPFSHARAHATANCLSEIPQLLFFFLFHAMRVGRYAAHMRIALAAAAPPCSIHVRSRFAFVLPLCACAE
jgi:hypothetical protein